MSKAEWHSGSEMYTYRPSRTSPLNCTMKMTQTDRSLFTGLFAHDQLESFDISWRL